MSLMAVIILVGSALFFGSIMARNTPMQAARDGSRRGVKLLAIGASCGVILVLVSLGVYRIRGQVTDGPAEIALAKPMVSNQLSVDVLPTNGEPRAVKNQDSASSESMGESLNYKVDVPWFTLMAVVGFLFIVAIGVRRRMSPSHRSGTPIPSSRGHVRNWSGAAKLAVIVAILAGGWWIAMPSFKGSMPSDVSSNLTNSGDSSAVDTVRLSPSVVVEPVAIKSVGLLAICAVVGIILFWPNKASNRTNEASDSPQGSEQGFGLSGLWLVVPVAGLAFLAVRTADVFKPSQAPNESEVLRDFPQQHARMLKSAKELVEAQPTSPRTSVTANDWILKGTNGTLEPHHMLLVSGQFSSVQEAEAELVPMVVGLVQRAFHQNHSWEGNWTVPTGLVRERVIEREYIDRKARTIGNFTGDLFRLYYLVDLSPDALRTFESHWKSSIVERRLAGLGLILGWIISQLLLAWIYFQIQGANPRRGRWRWKLLAALISISLTLAANYGLTQISTWG